jgi:hypothetical protein
MEARGSERNFVACLTAVSDFRLVTMRLEAASRLASVGLMLVDEYANPLDLTTIGGMG